MIIGVPKEIKNNESRVALTPHGAMELINAGHTVVAQRNAGIESGFPTEDYEKVGCKVLDTAKEVFDAAEMIVKVKEPQPEEIAMVRAGQTMFTYFHFAADETLTRDFLATGATAIAYETIMLEDRSLPLLVPMSEVAGRMATQEGAKYLERAFGGSGVLLGGVPGVRPGTVTVLGGGVVGTNAALMAAGLGANVYILDNSLPRLRYLEDVMPANVHTVYSNSYNIAELLPETDLLIGAVLIVGAKAPKLVTRDMLKLMKNRSVIVDVAVDQGGCIETCRATTHANPTFEVEGVLHYCVANMPGAVPFTSTVALTNATMPYTLKLANQGPIDALKNDSALLLGLNTYKQQITHKGVADAFGLDYVAPAAALAK